METKAKNRGWVKNVAIIFLAVLLVLTFFSNTILNRSLPEVATQNIMGGTITARIRVTGTVSANQTFQVIIDQSRRVRTVMVREGQEVNPGDVLFVLADTESAELEQAQETLRQLQRTYQEALINASGADYAAQDRQIQQARDALAAAEEARDALNFDEETIAAAEKVLDAAELEVLLSESRLKNAQKRQKEAQSALDQAKEALEGLGGLNKGDAAAEEKALRAAQDAYDAAAAEYNAARDSLAAARVLYGAEYDRLLYAACRRLAYEMRQPGTPVDNRIPSPTKVRNKFSDAFRKYVETYYLPYAVADLNGESSGLEGISDAGSFWPYNEDGHQFPGDSDEDFYLGYCTGADDDGLRSAETHYDAERAELYRTAHSEVAKQLAAADAALEALDAAELAVQEAQEAVRAAQGEDNSAAYSRLQRAVELAAADVDAAEQQTAAAQKEYDSVVEERDSAKTALEDAKAKKTEYETALRNANETVKSCEQNLEDLLFALQEQQKSDNKSARLDALRMQEYVDQINKQKKLIEELSEDSMDKEITAEVGGTIESLGITAGQNTTPGTPMATIELPDMGYTLTASVANDQARRVHVGDTASVSNVYWGNQIDAVLTDIRTDPRDPQNSKQLSFEVSGDVTPGSSLTLSVGQRSAEYEFVVPNSAIRSDTNGDFLLIVVAKNSPLGDRYTATRVDVTRLASDDTSTAVTGALELGDFVITTSTAPVKNGDRVRFAESAS